MSIRKLLGVAAIMGCLTACSNNKEISGKVIDKFWTPSYGNICGNYTLVIENENQPYMATLGGEVGCDKKTYLDRAVNKGDTISIRYGDVTNVSGIKQLNSPEITKLK